MTTETQEQWEAQHLLLMVYIRYATHGRWHTKTTTYIRSLSPGTIIKCE